MPAQSDRDGRGGEGQGIINVAKEDLNGWLETVHLLSSPKNAEILMRSIHQARKHTVIREADETDAEYEARCQLFAAMLASAP